MLTEIVPSAGWRAIREHHRMPLGHLARSEDPSPEEAVHRPPSIDIHLIS
jgi:hypothetical protein